MKKIDYKSLIFNLFIPVGLSLIITMLLNDIDGYYDSLIKPIQVPMMVFPIVWFTLYIMMGTANFLVERADVALSKKASSFYFLQLLINLLWPVFFFGFKLQLFSVIWLLGLLVLIIYTMSLFYKINKISFYLMIPYLLWSIFAAILNITIYIANT